MRLCVIVDSQSENDLLCFSDFLGAGSFKANVYHGQNNQQVILPVAKNPLLHMCNLDTLEAAPRVSRATLEDRGTPVAKGARTVGFSNDPSATVLHSGLAGLVLPILSVGKRILATSGIRYIVLCLRDFESTWGFAFIPD